MPSTQLDQAQWLVMDKGSRAEAKPPLELGLCLSGGGYRAMLFHVGVLWRLNELGVLRKLSRVSSVSGGSITAAVVASRWSDLAFDDASGVARAFQTAVVAPIRKLASQTIDASAVLMGALLPGVHAGDRLAKKYAEPWLLGDRTLQDLPADDQGPRFVFNATSVQSGKLFRFSRPYAADYKLGVIDAPTFSLADVVAASSAFPPFLSPVRLSTRGMRFHDGDPAYESCRDEIVLTDGGVYDNLGLETVIKRCKRVLVSDGGGSIAVQPNPSDDWVRHSKRVIDIIYRQVHDLRERMLRKAFDDGVCDGFLVSIHGAALPVWNAYNVGGPADDRPGLNEMDTRLEALDDGDQERLINRGYALCCDQSARLWSVAPNSLPYPAVEG